jgi:hypothetical protein
MGEDLKRCNLKFRELIENMKSKRKVTKEEESLAYWFFMMGFAEGSGMTQEVA